MTTPMLRRDGIARTCTSLATVALVLVNLLMSIVFATPSMHAQTRRVLHKFMGPDGSGPEASLIRDSAGTLYGTTRAGGTSGGFGTVFKFDRAHTLTVLHSFAGNDGSVPLGPLLRDAAGNLYGTASAGGAANFGVVYEINTSGNEALLHSFHGKDGKYPQGNLVRDKSGNLYGTTTMGGSADGGIVFKLSKSGKLTTLHTFTGTGEDGYYPDGSLVLDATGNLYGTCRSGGSGSWGIVYKLDTAGTLTVLHAFELTDGGFPLGGLIADAAGNLYGTAFFGGGTGCGGDGCGTVFRVVETTGSFALMHSFDTNGLEGSGPLATLARDPVGNLYGANSGGGGGCPPRFNGCGTIWKLDTNNQLTVLTNFGKGDLGFYPYGGVALDKVGNLYGTTFRSGCRGCGGTVFKITP